MRYIKKEFMDIFCKYLKNPSKKDELVFLLNQIKVGVKEAESEVKDLLINPNDIDKVLKEFDLYYVYSL